MIVERRINLKLNEDIHTRLKVLAAKEKTTLQHMLARWVSERLVQAEKAGGAK